MSADTDKLIADLLELADRDSGYIYQGDVRILREAADALEAERETVARISTANAELESALESAQRNLDAAAGALIRERLRMHGEKQRAEAAERERDTAVREIEAADVMIDEWTGGGIQTNDLAVDVRLVLESWEAAATRAEAAEAQRDTLAASLPRLLMLAERIGGSLDGRGNDEYFEVRTSEFWNLRQAAEPVRAALAAVTPPEAERNYGTPTLPVTLQALLHTDDDDAPPEEPQP